MWAYFRPVLKILRQIPGHRKAAPVSPDPEILERHHGGGRQSQPERFHPEKRYRHKKYRWMDYTTIKGHPLQLFCYRWIQSNGQISIPEHWPQLQLLVQKCDRSWQYF